MSSRTNNQVTKIATGLYSSDREERIASRRARLAAKLEQKKNQEEILVPIKEIEDKPQVGSGDVARKQIQLSRQNFQSVKKNGLDDVMSAKLNAEEKEKKRKEELEEKRALEKEKKEKEKAESEELNQKILNQYEKISLLKVPEDLVKAIQSQKELCSKVINSKDSLIKEYQQELKIQEEHYTKALETKQGEEIEEVIGKMREKYNSLVQSYEEELKVVEEAFLQERKEHRQAMNVEMEELYEERRKKEQVYMEWKQERAEEARNQIEELRILEAEEYNEMKIKLELEIQTLEQYYQALKSSYQLYNDKITHNLRLLGEREFEHLQVIQQQKKKINRLQDMLSTLKAAYTKHDKKFRQKNVELTEEYKRITEQYKDLQLKFRHFQDRDHKKYCEIWDMNEQRVSELVNRLLKADRVIAEQQLGLLWYPPTEDLLKIDLNQNPVEKQPSKAKNFKQNNTPIAQIYSDNKRIIDLICDEAGFLVEDRVMKILSNLEKDEQNLIKIESILQTLGIEGPQAIEQFLTYFVTSTGEQPVLVSPNQVIAALKLFITKHQTMVKEAVVEQAITTEEEKKEKKRRAQEKEFWERLANVVPSSTIKVWGHLERELMKFNSVLNERAKLLSETDLLRKENDDLKMLLNQYITSGINDELEIPPVSRV